MGVDFLIYFFSRQYRGKISKTLIREKKHYTPRQKFGPGNGRPLSQVWITKNENFETRIATKVWNRKIQMIREMFFCLWFKLGEGGVRLRVQTFVVGCSIEESSTRRIEELICRYFDISWEEEFTGFLLLSLFLQCSSVKRRETF